MAISGNWDRKLGDKDKAPVLKQSIRHRDVILLEGSRAPSRLSYREIKALRKRGVIE